MVQVWKKRIALGIRFPLIDGTIVTDASPDIPSDERIVLAHGGGGELTRLLLQERIVPKLANRLLDPLGDGAILPAAA